MLLLCIYSHSCMYLIQLAFMYNIMRDVIYRGVPLYMQFELQRSEIEFMTK